ncbi:hypothetical protein Tco_0457683 [Tanacetum coccineum]
MENSKRVLSPYKKDCDLNKTQGASTPEEVKRMKNVPYALAVDPLCIKAEYIAASEAAMEAVWIRKFISGLDDNLADLFTKALSKGKLTQYARRMGLRLASSFM